MARDRNRLAEDQIDKSHPALSEIRPWFVDNQNGNTLASAIKNHLQALRIERPLMLNMSIATAFFTVPGFRLLADELEQLNGVQLLLGAEPLPESMTINREPGDPQEPDLTRNRVADSLNDQRAGLELARNLLPFDEDSDRAIRKLLELIHAGKIDVKRYEKNYLHAKAYIFRIADGGLLVGSSNMTHSGLSRNLELNLGHYEDPVVEKVEVWFDELWEDAEPFDLAELYDRMLAEYSPYLIYLKVLWHLYGDELQQELEEADLIPVTTFQQHGIWRALNILNRYGGVIVADGVGLGKSFIAGEIIRQYRERRQKVLMICPAALRDGTWEKFMTRFDLHFECISYEQLALDRQLGGSGEYIKHSVEDYQLVVIDEAHAYRNPSSPARAQVLRSLLGGQRRDLLMLTATPVNNSLWDLYHLINYFVRQDAQFADTGILSMRKLFTEANQTDPQNLNPDTLYPIIDATTVKRTRQFIRRYYENDLIAAPDGRMIPIQFPTPIASSIFYDLEESLPGFLDDLEAAIHPAVGNPDITFARYKVNNYPVGSDPDDNDTMIVGLIRSGILKRFESSVYAFARTVRKMANEHRSFLDALKRGYVIQYDLVKEYSISSDDDEIEELLSASEESLDAKAFNVKALRDAVESDLEILDGLATRAEAVQLSESPKLHALVDQLADIAQVAREEAIDEEQCRDKRKVLVFSFFSDTVDWIEDYLSDVIASDDRLADYRGRFATVAGNDSRNGVSREDAVYGFSPKTVGLKPGDTLEKADKYDLLVATDVLAEGMNLQQARHIINIDLPWNPMRLVQRHGRIDRIGSEHDEVFLRTFFPDEHLDRLLELEDRVRHKLAQAAASVGVEVTPIEGGAESEVNFSQTREEIERLRREDPSLYERGGTRSSAQSGEEYRHELRTQLQVREEEIVNLPWKAGSGLATGNQRGHFFCAKVGDRTYLRFVPFGDNGENIISELATCLRMIECTEETERVMPTDLKQTTFSAWELARQTIHARWMYETDPANLQPRVAKINRDVADFLRDNPPPDTAQQRLTRILDAVESPCGNREQRQLRNTFNDTYPTNAERATALVAQVEALGLEPYKAPKPLPPITPDDVHLLVWMAIESIET